MRGAVLRFGQFDQGRARRLALGKFKLGRGAHSANGRNRRPFVAHNQGVALLHAHGGQHALAGKGVKVEVGYGLAVAHKANIAVAAAHRVKAASLVQKTQQRVAGCAGIAPRLGHAAGHKYGHRAGVEGGGINLGIGVAVGGQFAAQGFCQLVVAKARNGYGPHFGHIQMAVGSNNQGAVNLEVAAPKTQHHPVAGCDDRGVLGVLGRVLALRKIALKQVGCVGLRSVLGLGRTRQGQKNQQKSKQCSVRHGSDDAMGSGLHGPQRWFHKQAGALGFRVQPCKAIVHGGVAPWATDTKKHCCRACNRNK